MGMGSVFRGFFIVVFAFGGSLLSAQANNIRPTHCNLENLFDHEGSPKKQIIFFRGRGGVEEDRLKILRSISPSISFTDNPLDGSMSLVTGALVNLDQANWHFFSSDEWFDHGVSEAVECTDAILKKTNGSKRPTFIVAGYSHGGRAAFEYAGAVKRRGIRIALGISIDPVGKGAELLTTSLSLGVFDSFFFRKGGNVDRWVNLIQRDRLPWGGKVDRADRTVTYKGVGGHIGITRSPKVHAVIQEEIRKIPAFQMVRQ